MTTLLRVLFPALLLGSALSQQTAPLQPTTNRVCTPQVTPDGQSDDTAALQRALDDCAAPVGKTTGGEVHLTAGRYLSGPLFLRTGETLHLDQGAVLLGTTVQSAYLKHGAGGLWSLLNGSGVQNVTLEGPGTVDGQGQAWWAAVKAARAASRPDPLRPRLIGIDHVQNLTVTGLTLQNSPSFHLVPSHAEGVTVRGLTIRAPADSPNTDGIDPSDVRDVTITDSTFDTGDDDIAIKAGDPDLAHPGAASGNILIQNCTFLHGHGLSIGSETNGGVQGVTGRHLSFTGTDNGLRIKTLRGKGGVIDDIVFQDVQMQGVKVALAFTAYYPKVPATDPAQPVTETTPDLRRIQVSDLSGTGAGQLGVIAGLPERPVQAVTLTRVNLSGIRGLSVQNASVVLAQTTLKTMMGTPVLTGPGASVTGTEGTGP